MIGQSGCAKCGAAIRLGRRGHLEIARCPNCGAEMFATVFPADEVREISKPEKVIARLRWKKGQLNTNELAAIRKIVPALCAKPLSEFIQTSSESPTLELGIFNRSQGTELVEHAARVGLTVFLEPI